MQNELYMEIILPSLQQPEDFNKDIADVPSLKKKADILLKNRQFQDAIKAIEVISNENLARAHKILR